MPRSPLSHPRVLAVERKLDAGELETLEKHELHRPGILGQVVTDIFKGLGRGKHKVG